MAGVPKRFHEDLAACLELVKAFDVDLDQHGWKVIENASNDENVQVWRRDCVPGKMELNFRQILPIPLEAATSWMRASEPPKESPMNEIFEEWVCLKSFGPGDLICSVKFVKWYAVMLDLLMGMKYPETLGETLLTRLVTRRDCPGPGLIFFGGFLLEQNAQAPLWGIVMKEGTQPDLTTLHEVWQFPYMRPDLLQPVVENMCRLYSKQDWEGDPAEIEEKHGYIVMTIRKCCRGPPLLPFPPEDGSLEPLSEEWLDALTWEAYEDPSAFTLPKYMGQLLNCFGKKHIEVFDSLDGRHLLFYQAAARRTEWLEISGIWQLFTRRHSAAYRRRFGGSGAPGFQGNVAPRFGNATETKASGSETTSTTEEEEREDYPWTWGIPVQNTFVHFPTDRSEIDLKSSPV